MHIPIKLSKKLNESIYKEVFIMNTQKKLFSIMGTVFAVAGILFFSLGCDADTVKAAGNSINSGINNGVNNAADQSETGFKYTFYNRSNYTVNITPQNEDEFSLLAGESATYTFSKRVRISRSHYFPSDLVSVRQSAFSFYFENR